MTMKIAYAFRRSTYYPFESGAAWELPDERALSGYLGKARDIGFDGVELGIDNFLSSSSDASGSSMASGASNGGLAVDARRVAEMRKRLDGEGMPCVAVRAGGALRYPRTAAHNRKRLETAVEIADGLGAGIVNTALSGPARNRMRDTGPSGAPESHGSSQTASEEDFVRTAAALREVGAMAGARGIHITVEVHQHSIADNSWSTLHLLDLADSEFVHANPDLGNVLWNYDEPEETMEQCISALAGRSKYWHCKSLNRVHIPELDHSYYIRVPLPDGDIDYRFAIGAMVDAGYDGYLAIEGANAGDQLHKDRRSVDYVRGILGELEA